LHERAAKRPCLRIADGRISLLRTYTKAVIKLFQPSMKTYFSGIISGIGIGIAIGVYLSSKGWTRADPDTRLLVMALLFAGLAVGAFGRKKRSPS
jgi:hypothetical protein